MCTFLAYIPFTKQQTDSQTLRQLMYKKMAKICAFILKCSCREMYTYMPMQPTCVKTTEAVLHDKHGISEIGSCQLVAAKEAI